MQGGQKQITCGKINCAYFKIAPFFNQNMHTLTNCSKSTSSDQVKKSCNYVSHFLTTYCVSLGTWHLFCDLNLSLSYELGVITLTTFKWHEKGRNLRIQYYQHLHKNPKKPKKKNQTKKRPQKNNQTNIKMPQLPLFYCTTSWSLILCIKALPGSHGKAEWVSDIFWLVSKKLITCSISC